MYTLFEEVCAFVTPKEFACTICVPKSYLHQYDRITDISRTLTTCNSTCFPHIKAPTPKLLLPKDVPWDIPRYWHTGPTAPLPRLRRRLLSERACISGLGQPATHQPSNESNMLLISPDSYRAIKIAIFNHFQLLFPFKSTIFLGIKILDPFFGCGSCWFFQFICCFNLSCTPKAMPPQPLRWLRARRWGVYRVHSPILAPTKNGGILVWLSGNVASVVIWYIWCHLEKTPRWNWWTCFNDHPLEV